MQRQAGLSWLDGEEPLPLKVEQMLLLDLLDLQELLLESQLLGRNLLKATHTAQHNNQHNSWYKHTKEALVHTIYCFNFGTVKCKVQFVNIIHENCNPDL